MKIPFLARLFCPGIVAELKRLEDEKMQLVSGNLTSLKLDPGRLDATFKDGHGIKILAASFGSYFRNAGAVNFLTVDVCDRTIENDHLWLTVTLQRKGGQSPAEKLAVVTKELDRSKETVRALAGTYFRRVLMGYGSDYQHDEIVNMMNTDAADAVRAAQAAHRDATTKAVQP